MVSVGFIVDGETEMKLFNSPEIKNQLKTNFEIEVKEVVKYSGANSIKSDTEDLLMAGAKKVIVLKDLEQLPSTDALKTQLAGNDKLTNDNILVVVDKMIEAWFLADTEALNNINPNLGKVNNPESYTNPSSELKRRLRQVNRNYGKLSKPAMANLFINKGFSFESAANHPQCHSAKNFIKELKKIPKDS